MGEFIAEVGFELIFTGSVRFEEVKRMRERVEERKGVKTSINA